MLPEFRVALEFLFHDGKISVLPVLKDVPRIQQVVSGAKRKAFLVHEVAFVFVIVKVKDRMALSTGLGRPHMGQILRIDHLLFSNWRTLRVGIQQVVLKRGMCLARPVTGFA